MIGFEQVAVSIIARIETLSGFKTVLHLGDEGQQRRRPAELPAAYLAMARTDLKDGGNNHNDGMIAWHVLVRSRKMAGTGGALDLVDQVLDVLSGYRPVVGFTGLVPVSVEYFNEDGRADIAYILSFTTTVAQLPMGDPC